MGMAGNAAIPLRKFETCLHGCVNACGRMRVKGGCERGVCSRIHHFPLTVIGIFGVKTAWQPASHYGRSPPSRSSCVDVKSQ